MEKKRVLSFKDLEVYRRTYDASIAVMSKIIPKLPYAERRDLCDHLSRSSKAIPRLIAEGYAKRNQRLGFQKYLDDAMAENNETIVSLSQCRDVYPQHIDIKLCGELIETYDIAGRMLYRLAESWNRVKKVSKVRYQLTPTTKPSTSPNPNNY
jgi:four helix bundle protein